MPSLQDIPDLFAGYDPNSGYLAIPPVDPSSSAAELLLAGDKATRQAFALQDFRSFASVAQGAIARQSQRMGGVPVWAVEPLRIVFSEIPLVDGKSLVKFVGDKVVEAVSGVAEDVSNAIEESTSAYPLVGAIVKIGIRLAMFIREQVKDERDNGPRPPSEFTPLVYDYARDVGQGTLFDGLAGGDDWTSVFMPASDDPDFKAVRLEAGAGMPSVRWRVSSDLGHGLMPGIPDQVGVYQSLHMQAPITNGDLLPSGRKFAMQLWQTAMKPSVQMFMVDSHAVEAAWIGYYNGLWKFAERDFGSLQLDEHELMWLRARIRQSASYSRLYECDGAGKPGKIVNCQGKPPIFKPESVIEGFSRDKLAKRVKLTGLYGDIVSYVCQVHRERAMATLDTLLVAYIPSDAPLLRADAALAARHTEVRKLLLEHKARYQVELELVPTSTDADQAFREDLVRSRLAADVDLKAGKGRAKPGRWIPEVVPSKDRAPLPDAPPIGLPEGVGSTGGGDGGVGWFFAGLGGTALVAAGIAIARRRRR